MEKSQSSSLWTRDFIGITLVNLLLFCGFEMLLPTLSVYVKSLGGADSIIGWLTGVVTVASLLIRPLSGIALDKFGRKPILLAGMGVMLAVALAYAWFPVIGAILAIRFIHGFGWGIATTASNTVASDIIPKRRFGEGMGLFNLSSSLAMALTPGIGLYVLAVFHFKSLALLVGGLTALALLLSFTIRYRQIVGQGAIKRAALYEKSSLRPSLVVLFVSATYGAVTGFISLYALERGIANIGAFFTVYALSLLVSRPLFGKLVDRFGFDSAVYPGLVLLIAALFLLSSAATLPYFLISALLYGVGFGAVQASLQAMAVVSAPPDRLGAANATFFTGFDSGIGIGSVTAGLVASAVGYSRMFFVFPTFLVLAGVLYFAIAKSAGASVKIGQS